MSGMNHTLELFSSFLEPGWHVECSCGWRDSEPLGRTADEAKRLGAEHIEGLAPQPERGADF